MSFFMISMPLDGLMSRPPVSKQMPLPTSVTVGAPARPQLMSISRGGAVAGAADGVDHREVLGEQVVADDAGDGWRRGARRAGARRPPAPAGPRSLAGVLIEVAAQPDAVDDGASARARRRLAAASGGSRAAVAAVAGLVAAEAIGAEAPGDGGKLGVIDVAGQTVEARRQHGRQRAERPAPAGPCGSAARASPSRSTTPASRRRRRAAAGACERCPSGRARRPTLSAGR